MGLSLFKQEPKIHMKRATTHTEIKILDLSWFGQKRELQILLSTNISPNIFELNNVADKVTPLILSSYKGEYDIVSMLCNHGADTNWRDSSGVTALMYASWKGHLKVVELLCVNGANINIRDDTGETALMKAVRQEQLKVVEFLCSYKEGANLNYNNKHTNETALSIAIWRGSENIVIILLKSGAHVSKKDYFMMVRRKLWGACQQTGRIYS